jgi:iron complex outermembrane receptor protein
MSGSLKTSVAVKAILCPAVTVAVMAFGLMVQASAQTAPAGAASNEISEIVVTGSMLKKIDAENAESISIIKMDSLKDLGITTVEGALALVSANNQTVTTGSNVASFSGGASLASLRGLGATKTLVLLDGQRLANNVTFGAGVDLNTIPFAAIDHIEVLKEGASSLYGSDAIAGVINFITKKDYNGGELNVNYSKPQHGGGSSDNIDLSFGKGNLQTDGYNFMVTGSFSQQKELTASERPFTTAFNPQLNLNTFNGPFGPSPGSYTDGNGDLYQVGFPQCAGNPHLAAVAGSCQYVYTAAVDLTPKSKSESALVSFTKTIPGNNTLSVQYFYSRFDLQTWGGPQEYGFFQNPTSPFYPTAAQSTCVFTPCTPGGPALGGQIQVGWTDPANNRFFGNINTEQRALVTFAGSNAGWDYSTSFDWSQNKGVQQVRGGEANYATIAPNNVLSDLINPFGPQTAAGQAFINSAYMNGDLEVGKLSSYGLNGHASHALGDLFDAGRPAQVAVGFDYRDEQISSVPTALATTLQPATFFPPTPIFGSRVSEAAFAEFNVPVSKNAEFTISDRQDRFSDFGTTNNAKVSFAYQPVSVLKIRGAASTGFRAPSLVEEFSPQVLGATAANMTGPGCASGNYTVVFSQANCLSQGEALSGGNPNLQPEKSQNFDLGFILQPLANLSMTVDYFRINLKERIGTVPSKAIYSNPTGFANLYVLNNAGTLTPASLSNLQCSPSFTAPTCGYILENSSNTGATTTDGFDLTANYVYDSDFGKFHLGYDSTFVTLFKLQQFAGGPILNLVGQFNNGQQPVIRYQHLITLDWSYQNLGAGLSEHFTEHYIDYAPDAAGNLLTVGNYSIVDGYVSYKPIPALRLLGGINNLLDTRPPFSNQLLNWQANYNPIFSDATGRTFYVRATFDF